MLKGCLVLMLVLLLGSAGSTAQTKPLPIEKVDSCMAVTAKPVLILLSTDWCKYCQMQKNQLRKNKNFQNSLAQFYYVEFNAESKKSIRFNGKVYQTKSSSITTGVHELAIALNGSELISFPTWVLFDKDYKVLFRYNGVLEPAQLKRLLEMINLK